METKVKIKVVEQHLEYCDGYTGWLCDTIVSWKPPILIIETVYSLQNGTDIVCTVKTESEVVILNSRKLSLDNTIIVANSAINYIIAFIDNKFKEKFGKSFKYFVPDPKVLRSRLRQQLEALN